MLKSDRARFVWKIHICPNLGKRGLKAGSFAFLENVVICFSEKTVQSIANPMSGKKLVLKFLTKMFLINQTAGFKV